MESRFAPVKGVFFCTLLLLLRPLAAAEVDHYSAYRASGFLGDSRELLNRSFNDRIASTLEKLPSGCNEKLLYRKLRKNLKGKLRARSWLRRDVFRNDQVDKQSHSFKGTIYRDFVPVKFIRFIGRPINLISPSFGDILLVGDVRLGVDKIGHFLGRDGYKMFKKYHVEEWPLRKSLRIGWKGEHGFWGGKTTRVISYADMLANFNGMRFWNHILQRREDVLGQNLGPYLECQGDRWVQVKEMDWSDYVDHGFDESINCSRFAKEKNLHKVQKGIRAALNAQNLGSETTCPLLDISGGHVSQQDLDELEDKYRDLAPYFLNFRGHNSLQNEDLDIHHPSP